MFRSPEAQAALAELHAACDPKVEVGRAYLAESEAAAVVEAIEAKYGEEYPPDDDQSYRVAIEANKRATFALATASARSIAELALKLAVMLLDHEPGKPIYMHEPHEDAGFGRVIAEIRAVAGAAKVR